MMGHTQIQQLEMAFKHSKDVLVLWKSGDATLADLLARDERMTRAAEWIVLRVSWSERAVKRGRRALGILASADRIARVTPHHHTVQSCSDASKKYNVRQKRCKWSCDCPDHRHRKAQCKHILAVMYHVVEREESVLNMHGASRDQNTRVSPDEQPDVHIREVGERPEKCVSCGYPHVIKWGFTVKGESRRQRYRCKNPQCGCTFVHRGGFERMRKPEWAILRTFKVPPARTGDEPNRSNMGHNTAQTEGTHSNQKKDPEKYK